MRIFQASSVVVFAVVATGLLACPSKQGSTQADTDSAQTPASVASLRGAPGRGTQTGSGSSPAELERTGARLPDARVDAGPPGPGDSASGESAAAADAGTGLEGSLEGFAGFSRDGAQFAFSVYSDGAGFYLLHIVEGPSGELKQRFILDGPENVEKARTFLKSKGFTQTSGTLPDGMKIDARIEGGQVVVTRRGGGQPDKTLHRGNPFKSAGGGKPQRVSVAQVSPKGDKIAIRAEQVPVTEFGGIVTYLLIDVNG